MDIAPIYELRTRLRAAMIAGTNLLSEDFRLKKAVENFKPLASASPVFGKINELSRKLLEDCSPETLIDTITLTDAVITTLGTTDAVLDIHRDPEDIHIEETSAVIVNAPYSQLSELINALTTSGSGNLNTVRTARNKNPDLLMDYRVIPALIKGLGASYSEFADLAESILTGIGKNIVPFLKRGFDPKGKKEMVRRVFIIEKLCGANENDFYLEQLNETERTPMSANVRKTLIYALRHDEQNIEKLIELTKTEKGKAKTAALAALMSYDNEKSADFFNRYSKKKPAEVVSLLRGVSSEWTSRLAARLIDELLIDKDGNKVTLSQIIDGKTTLKVKTDWITLVWAIAGKWGTDIEKVYREFDKIDTLDNLLGESIITTNDEGLKALAVELNNASENKDRYVFSEAAAYLLSDEDNSKWFEDEIARQSGKLSQVQYSKIRNILNQVYIRSGKYYLKTEFFNPIPDKFVVIAESEVLHPIKGAITDAMMKSSCWAFDTVLEHLIDENDKEYCKKLEPHFCKQLINFNGTGFANVLLWSRCIKKCGFRNVKNLAVDYFKNIKGKCYTAWVQTVIQDIPGDNEYKLSEAHAIIDLAKKNKPAWFNIEEFEDWANKHYANK